MTRMLIVGPAGSGKGTQSKRISEDLGIVAISTGDIFRVNIKEQTELGREAQGYVDAGDLVPDSVTNRMVEDRLTWEDAKNGFLPTYALAGWLAPLRARGRRPAARSRS